MDHDQRVLRIEQGLVPLWRTRVAISLDRVVGVTPGSDLELTISVADGSLHRLGPVAWSYEATARNARVLRDAIIAND